MNKTALKLAAAAAFGSAAIAIAAPALAQDAANADAPARAFQGPTVSASVGWDHLRSGSTNDLDGSHTKQSLDGVTYGGAIGYDHAVTRNITLGAEAELTGSSAKWDNNNGVPNTFSLGRVKAGRDFYVGARAGYAVSPETLVYVKGGYTNQKLKVLAGDTSQETNNNFKLDGWRVGGGVERALGPNSFAKLEYRYSKYNEAHVDYASGGTSADFDVDTDRHQIVASYGFRF